MTSQETKPFAQFSTTNDLTGDIMATAQQIALLNNLLPSYHRFQCSDKNSSSHKSKHKKSVI